MPGATYLEGHRGDPEGPWPFWFHRRIAFSCTGCRRNSRGYHAHVHAHADFGGELTNQAIETLELLNCIEEQQNRSLGAGVSRHLARLEVVGIAWRATYSGFPEMECPFVNGIDKGANRAGRLDGEMEEA